MLKTFIGAIAVLATTTAMPVYAQSFSPAPTTISGTGTGYVNGTPCTGAVVTGTVDSSGAYADVSFNNAGTLCAAYGVTARVWANGDLSNVVVTNLSNPVPPICDSGSAKYEGVVEYTNYPDGETMNGFVDDQNPVQVGNCWVAADMDVAVVQIVP